MKTFPWAQEFWFRQKVLSEQSLIHTMLWAAPSKEYNKKQRVNSRRIVFCFNESLQKSAEKATEVQGEDTALTFKKGPFGIQS
jgi:hypothetical protein